MHRGGMWTISGQGLKLGLQLLSTAILARLLAPADFGLLALVMPILAFFTVFRDVGLTSATIYSDDITPDEVTSLFWINAGAGTLMALLLIGISPLAGRFYGDARLTTTLQVMSITFVMSGVMAQYQALLQRDLKFKLLTLIDVGANVLGTALSIWAAFAGFGYWSLLVMPVTMQATNMIGTLVVSRWQPGRPCWQPRSASMARFGSAIAGFNILNYFARNVDNLLIGKVWGMEALGFYGRAYSLMMAPLSQVIYPLSQVVVPVLTRIRHDRERYLNTYLNMMRVIMLCCVSVVTCLLVGREWLVAILLGPKWQAAAALFLALGFSALVQPMNSSTGWLMLSQGRSRDIAWWGVISSVITVLSIVGALPFGTLAVASAYSLSQILIVSPLLWWFCCRGSAVRVSDMLSVSLPLWIACGIAGLSFEALHQWVLPPMLPVVGMALACVWVLSWVLLLLALHSSGREFLSAAMKLLPMFKR